MSIFIEKTTGEETIYPSPFATGGHGENVHVQVDVSALTAREVDERGYLKPGVPLVPETGTLPTAAGQQVVMVAAESRVARNNTSLAGITNDPIIACRAEGTVYADMLVSILGGELTAGERDAINASNLHLTVRSA